ncbi:MAG: carbohydrate kinase family protein [Vicinamibacterales bacterium]
MFDVLGVGSNSVDHVLVLPDAPPSLLTSAKITLRAQSVRCGGQTATTMGACRALGLSSSYIGVVGRDENGRRVRDALGRHGIDITHLVEHEASTQTATILIHPETGTRIVLSERDPRLTLRADELPADVFAAAHIVHVDDVDVAAAIHAARAAQNVGVPVTSDIDHVSDKTDELLAAVTIPIFDEDTPKTLTGVNDLEGALRKLRRQHPGVLCVTLGERGAMALEGDRMHYQRAFDVDACDTTGAGDVFRAGFIYGLRQAWPLPRMLEFAAAAAAVSCTRLGALDGVPSIEEVEQLLKSGIRRADSGR